MLPAVPSAKSYACEAMYMGKEQLKKEFWRLQEKLSLKTEVKIRQVNLDSPLLQPFYMPFMEV